MDNRAADDTDVRREHRASVGLAVLFVLVTGLAILDLVGDWHEGPVHVVVEGTLTALGLLGIARAFVLARRLLATSRARAVEAESRANEAREEASALAARLAASHAEAARFKQDTADLIGGLGAAIDRQLASWELSPAEKEIALLLLKGLSHKEIAEVRSVGETTVRQQARALYKKAGLGGRHDLAAFFLEDLLSPRA